MSTKVQERVVEKESFMKKLFSTLGPGIIIAATVFGPGSMIVATKAGTTAGYRYLWVLLISAFFMIAFTKISATVGCSSEESIYGLVKNNFGKKVAFLFGFSNFAICTGFQAGNNINTGISMNAIFPFLNVKTWIITSFIIIMILIWRSQSFYQLLEKIMTALILVMIFCFAGNLFAFIPNINIGNFVKGFIPSGNNSWQIIVSMSATTFSIAGAACQSYFVQGKGWKKDELDKAKKDSTSGIIILNIITAIILITAATVLPRNSQILGVLSISKLLEPFFGELSHILFIFGFFAATFSTVIANAVIGGTFLADTLGLGKTINDFWVKAFSSVILLFGASIGLIFGGNPVELTIMAQGSTVLGAPLVAIILFLIGNNKNIVGDKNKNSTVTNIICLLAIGWLLFLSVNQILLWNNISL